MYYYYKLFIKNTILNSKMIVVTAFVSFSLMLLINIYRYNPKVDGVYSDMSTHLMGAISLAYDFDFEYTKKDFERFQRITPYNNPDGLFLKINKDGVFYYAKPIGYAAAAAPFVRLFGFKGPFILNAILFLWMIAVSTLWLSRTINLLFSYIVASGFFIGSSFYPFVFVIHPDIFYAATLFTAVFFFQKYRICRSTLYIVIGGVLLGVAEYEKLPFAIIILSISVAAIILREWRAIIIVGLMGAITFGSLTSVNVLQDGNYTAYSGSRYGFKHTKGFPLVSDIKIKPASQKADTSNFDTYSKREWIINTAIEHLPLFPEKIRDYVVGQRTGLLIYFPFIFTIFAFFLLTNRGLFETAIWLGLFGYASFYALLFPENGFGGSGTFGNRYALQALAIAILSVNGPLRKIGQSNAGSIILTGVFATNAILPAVLLRDIIRTPNGRVAHYQSFVSSSILNYFPYEETLLAGADLYNWYNSIHMMNSRLFPVKLNNSHVAYKKNWLSLPKNIDNRFTVVSTVELRGITFSLYSSDLESLTIYNSLYDRIKKNINNSNWISVFVPLKKYESIRILHGTSFYYYKFGLQFNSLLSQVSSNRFSSKKVFLKSFKNINMNEIPDTTDIITMINSNPYTGACKSNYRNTQKRGLKALSGQHIYHLGDKLVFNKGSINSSVLRKCWSNSENFGTWSDGLESSIRLPWIQENNKNIVVRFVFLPYINSQRKQAAVKLIISGKQIIEWRFTKPGLSTRQAVIPANLITGSTIEFRLRHNDPVTPYELGLGKDFRYLNIAIISLELIPEERL